MKTAVEWLVEEMFKQGYLNDKPLTVNNIEYFVEQAKEMEKKQKGYSKEEVKTMLYNCVDVLEYNTKGLWNKDGLVNEIIETFKSE